MFSGMQIEDLAPFKTPPGQTPPPGEMATEAGGKHPTGMHFVSGIVPV